MFSIRIIIVDFKKIIHHKLPFNGNYKCDCLSSVFIPVS